MEMPASEVTPLDVVILQAIQGPQFFSHEEYRPGVCEREGCYVCRNLLITKRGTA